MNIGLIDVDGRIIRKKTKHGAFPNLALMKLSAWHRRNGDSVEWCFPFKRYDRIYASKVFTFTPDIDFVPQTDDLRLGGTGYFYPDGGATLPDEIEHIMPDYSIYGISDTAYGFMSRGCPRGCDFCIVAKKEGRASRKVADLREFWDGQRNIELFDPNTLACPQWEDILGQLADSGARVNINQGADIRMMTERKCEALNKVNIRMIHFAWDGNEDLEPLFRKYGPMLRQKERDRRVYVLTNFNTTMEWNLHRIYALRDCGFDPYVTVFNPDKAPIEIKKLQRWCNNKFVFRTCRFFHDYQNNDHPAPTPVGGLFPDC